MNSTSCSLYHLPWYCTTVPSPFNTIVKHACLPRLVGPYLPPTAHLHLQREHLPPHAALATMIEYLHMIRGIARLTRF